MYRRLGSEDWRDTGSRPRGRGAAGRQDRIVDLIGAGNLTVTLETDDGAQRYQGIVPMRAGDWPNHCSLLREFRAIADAAVAARRRIRSVGNAAAKASRCGHAAGRGRGGCRDAWRRVQLIGETLTPEELRTLADAEFCAACSTRMTSACLSRRRSISLPMFARAGQPYVAESGRRGDSCGLAERGEVEVHCDSASGYVFDAVM